VAAPGPGITLEGDLGLPPGGDDGGAASHYRPRMEPDQDDGAVSVVIADDQALVRAGFRAILESQPGITVVGEAGDGLDAIDLARRRRPDVVLMDIQMPGVDGLEATRRILDELGEHPVAVLMLTTFDLNEYVYDALRAGASGFLLKDVPPEQLVAAVRVVAAGDALIAPAITKRLIGQFARSAPPSARPAALEELTPRELEVLVLVARGLSNAEIAGELTLSEATVKTHVKRVLAKLDVRDRVQAVVLAYEAGLVTPGDSR
jgi:DNA-binding NarL/FixJ family response regulator